MASAKALIVIGGLAAFRNFQFVTWGGHECTMRKFETKSLQNIGCSMC